MRYAVTPRGPGLPVGLRAISDDWSLENGETFTVGEDEVQFASDTGITVCQQVLSEDGKSLRQGTDQELARPVARDVLAELDALKSDVTELQVSVSPAGIALEK